jgi:hypothetical protein
MKFLLHAFAFLWVCLASVVLPAADPAGLPRASGPLTPAPGFLLAPPQVTQPPSVGFPGKSEPEYKRCNQPFVAVDAALATDDRRTNGMVLSENGFPPTQQTRLSGGVANAFCQDTDVEISGWYSAGELSYLHETRVSGRVIVEVMPRVRVYGGFASWDNPEGFYRSNSLFGMLGAEYPSLWGTMFHADYLRDLRENGDWLTMTFLKSHEIGRTRAGAIFTYKQGLGATVTRNLPGNLQTPEITGVPSVFYRAILEIDDGPVTWYVEASPHVSFVSRQTGVSKHHMLVMAGLRFDLR